MCFFLHSALHRMEVNMIYKWPRPSIPLKAIISKFLNCWRASNGNPKTRKDIFLTIEAIGKIFWNKS